MDPLRSQGFSKALRLKFFAQFDQDFLQSISFNPYAEVYPIHLHEVSFPFLRFMRASRCTFVSRFQVRSSSKGKLSAIISLLTLAKFAFATSVHPILYITVSHLRVYSAVARVRVGCKLVIFVPVIPKFAFHSPSKVQSSQVLLRSSDSLYVPSSPFPLPSFPSTSHSTPYQSTWILLRDLLSLRDTSQFQVPFSSKRTLSTIIRCSLPKFVSS